MKKQFLIIGAGKFGTSIAHRLIELEQEVMVVDVSMAVVQQLSDEVKFVVQGDVTQEAFLRELGVRNFDVVVVSIGEDVQASIMVALLLKELGCKYLVAKAESEIHGKVLRKLGVDRVVFPEKEMGSRIAQNLVNQNILDFIDLSPEYSIVEMPILQRWVGRTVAEVDLRGDYGINIVAIRHGEEFTVKIGPDYEFKPGDVVLIVGEVDMIEGLSHGKN